MMLCATVPLCAQPPATPAAQPVAVVDGKPIPAEELEKLIRPQLQQLRNQEYEVRSEALDNLISQRLLEAAAQAKGVSVQQLLAQDVDSKVPEPTDPEIDAFYQGQKDRINRPLEEVKDQIRQLLKQNRQQQMRQSFVSSLRDSARITVNLAAPRTEVAMDPNRLRGSANAPVEIVEFSDFQCPYCQKAYPTVKALLAKYGSKVSLSYRDFPLRSIHPQAQLAAEAGRCAEEQGKFWEFHDALFETPNQLGREELALHAATVGADTEQFKSCLDSGRFDEAIEQDVQAGLQAGVSGTPAFFVNGLFLSGSQPISAFEKVIDGELAAQSAAATAN
jgi:protein-disulfide isomerase